MHSTVFSSRERLGSGNMDGSFNSSSRDIQILLLIEIAFKKA